MTKNILLLLSLLLGILMTASSLLHADKVERIINYHSHIAVHQDGNLIITETIKVLSAGDKIQRGIFRTFPTKYKDLYGNTVRVKFEILKITKNGYEEPFHTENVSNGVIIYIGSKDVFLSPGEYTYTIVYQTSRQIGFFDDFDELYWNVTGNDWDFVIERAEAVIELPPGARIINKIAYTGIQGEQRKNYAIGYDATRSVKFTTTRPLSPGQGLTIAVSWQKGIIAEPTMEQKIGYLFSDNQNSLAALVGFIILLLYYIQVWSRVGKDPEKGVIYPQFAPPPGFSPAATRYVMQMGYSDRAFSAAIVNMAVKGFLKITENNGSYTLAKTDSDYSQLSAGEKRIAHKLFANRDIIELKQKNHVTVQSAISELKKTLKLDFEKIHFRRNSDKMLPGIIISILTFAAVIYYSSEREGAAFMTVWLAGWTIGTGFLVYMVINSWRAVLSATQTSASEKAGAVIITLFSLPFIGGELVGIFTFVSMTSPLAVVLVLSVIVTNLVFYRLLKAPTILGRRMMDHIEGFKMYLETAEEARLDMMTSPHKTPELFEKFLPYALALDVENNWAKKFNDVLTRSGQTDDYSPSWYMGRSWSTIGAIGFASSLGSSLSGAISSSASAPGSRSGSSGGGSSGGGGGGGGGGGW